MTSSPASLCGTSTDSAHKCAGTCDFFFLSSLASVPPQAMGIYLYGELMVNEDARQQQLARKCFELSKEQMDRSSAEVVAEMLF